MDPTKNVNNSINQDIQTTEMKHYSQSAEPTIGGELSLSGKDGGNKKPYTYKRILFVLVLFTLALVIASVAYMMSRNKVAYTQCSSTTGNTVTQTKAEVVYARFIQALKQRDQACVNQLSSNYFKQQDTRTEQWIKVMENSQKHGAPGGVLSVAEFAPNDYESSKFTQENYTRTIWKNNSDGTQIEDLDAKSTAPKGIILTYPMVWKKVNNMPTKLSVSFVAENNQILVDDILANPVSALHK
ncbi:MAG TPA: hypothetical protein PJ984_01010 [Candidatus Saccharibacteria bacterium]|jgi:hypothetical protein|nr:hypothetical protein [Patescibacteria group bacterium]HMS30958.1 hypothetical protein [Candidatus Saccharibacteria bacterium]